MSQAQYRWQQEIYSESKTQQCDRPRSVRENSVLLSNYPLNDSESRISVQNSYRRNSVVTTTVGSSDYLVLSMGTPNDVSFTANNPNYYFESDASTITNNKPNVSRLTKKLSKHRSMEFPADEITESASTIDNSMEKISQDDSIDHPSNSNRYNNEKNFDVDKKNESETYMYNELHNDDDGNINLLEISHISLSSNEQIDSNNTVVRTVNNNCTLNTTSNSTIQTHSTSSMLRLPLPEHRRYNHYDWSYSEETNASREMLPPTHNKIDSELRVKQPRSFDDTSTVATAAISNTSQVVTPDTSFEAVPQLPAKNSKKAIINNNPLKQDIEMKQRSTTSSRSAIEQDTLVIVKGIDQTLEFRHSSLILQYASAELAKHFVECIHDDDGAATVVRDDMIQFILNVQVNNANDWRALQPFLEPHAVQPAVVTTTNLPVLLPWFQQLSLKVLLQECDVKLLYHLAMPPISLLYRHTEFVLDEYVTVSNTLLLGQIAIKAGLESSSKKAFIVASAWLTHFPEVWLHHSNDSTALLIQALSLIAQCLIPDDDDDDDDDDSLDSSHDQLTGCESTVATSWESRFHPPEAGHLFASTITCLPKDCVEQQQLHSRRNIYSFVKNPLTPYLIREGIQKRRKQQPSISDIDYEVDNLRNIDGDSPTVPDLQLIQNASSDVYTESIADTETITTGNLSSKLSGSHMLQKDVESQDTLNNPSFLQVAEEIHAGWNSLWMKIAEAAAVTDVVRDFETDSSMHQQNYNTSDLSMSCTMSDQQKERQLLQTPHELSKWLNLVWDKICNPPLFGRCPIEDGKDIENVKHDKVPSPNAASSRLCDIRKRLNNSLSSSRPNSIIKSKTKSTKSTSPTISSSRRTFAC
jgi:hypothetical protein